MSLLWCGRSKRSPSPSPRGYSLPLDSIQVMITGEECDMSVPERTDLPECKPGPDDYALITVIGRCCNGAGKVHLGRHVPSGHLVAVKIINMEECEIDFKLLQHEILMHRVLNQASILESLCTFVHNNDVWSIMPLMHYGSCKDLIHAHFNEGLSEPAIAYILREVVTALDYMHNRGIIHRDIRASHVLIADSGAVCLTGLRHSYSTISDGRRYRAIHDFPTHYNKSLLWASPEILEQNLAGYNTRSDIYSVGIMACELANGIVPFSDVPLTQMLLEKLDGITPQLLDSTTMPHIPQDDNTGGTDSGIGESVANPSEGNDVGSPQRTFSQAFHHFVQTCLNSDPEIRPSAAELLQHAFFRQIKRKSAMNSLPELLHPVSPLSDVTALPADTAGVDSVSDQLGGLGIQDNNWDF